MSALQAGLKPRDAPEASELALASELASAWLSASASLSGTAF
jgi:hypothetical protein